MIDFSPISYKQAKQDFKWDVNPLFDGTNVEQQWLDFWHNTLDPRRATHGAAGYDLFAPYGFSLKPGEEITIPTGFRVLIQYCDVALFILPRSGAGFKYYARLANTLGLIDKDYAQSANEGHCFARLRNESSDKEWVVKTGEAYAQGVFLPYYLTARDDMHEKQNRNGGLGSTTKNA